MNNVKTKAVYIITGSKEKKFWNRIGVAFVNRDGSLNVKLEALPLNGELHIRDFESKDEGKERDREPEGRGGGNRRDDDRLPRGGGRRN